MARKGTYTATFTFNGKRYYAYGKSQKEADRNAIKKQTLLEADVKQYDSCITASEWSKEWLVSYKSGAVNTKWYKQMQSLIDTYIVPDIGNMRITDVKPTHISRLINKHKDKSESFQKKLLLVLRQIFDSAEENDVINKNPTKRIKVAVKQNESGFRTISDAERELTLQTADRYPHDGMFFLIMLFCGCRPGEVSRLRMKDYNSRQRILFVHEARKSDGSIGSTKSESGIREVPVPDYLADRLDALDKTKNEFICTALNGSPLTESSQRKMWLRFKKEMDVLNGAKTFRGAIVESTLADDLRPYCYRHTYCTDLQDAGVPITVAQRFMGHSDIRMTANIYTHKTDASTEDARIKLNMKHKKEGE